MDRNPGRGRRVGADCEVDSSYETTDETQEESSDVTVEEVVEVASPGPERDDAVGDMCESDNILRQELDELLKSRGTLRPQYQRRRWSIWLGVA